MASISHASGLRTIQFVGADGKRRSIRLGRASKKQAETIRGHIEQLVIATRTGHVRDDTARWVSETIDDAFRTKLANVGLIERREVAKLGEFISQYVAQRTDIKPATGEIWKQGIKSLLEHFGKDCVMRTITAGHADAYRRHLLSIGLASATASKRLRFAKMLFRAASRLKLIDGNPFADVLIKSALPDRRHFITRQQAAALLEACPNQDWRTIVCLARYGGLRCPSEVLSLRWEDIDWHKDRIRVWSPKTEHHPGKESRVIPLFPELRETLADALELAPDGSVYVVDHQYRQAAQGKSGWRGCNLRTTFQKIVKRAGLTPWPRLFHNLRSSRETELCEQFPMHCVAAWLGHSTDVALKHYCQVTDDHFAKAVQNPVQRGAKPTRGEKQPKISGLRNLREKTLPTTSRDLLHTCSVGDTGFEPVTSAM